MCTCTQCQRCSCLPASFAQCPLCMEPFELDDISFYPCTCGYQVGVYASVHECVCVHGCIRACVHACVCVCACVSVQALLSLKFEGSDRAQTVDVHCSGNVTAQNRYA